MAIIGIILLVVLQAGNNSVFDRVFPVAKLVNIPPGLDARQAELLTYSKQATYSNIGAVPASGPRCYLRRSTWLAVIMSC